MTERHILTTLILPLAITLGLLLQAAYASPWGPYQATYVNNHDGDTVTLSIELYDDLFMVEPVRMQGIDAPELTASSPCEKELAKQSKQALQDLLNGQFIRATLTKRGIYARPGATLTVGDMDVGQAMVDAGYARPSGGRRSDEPWCED